MTMVGISIKPGDARARALALELCDWLEARGHQPLLDHTLADDAGDRACAPLEELARRVELMVVLGGDGTLLHAGRRFVGRPAPLLGVNLGRLGFLTGAPADQMLGAVAAALEGRARLVPHFCLKAEVWRDGERLSGGVAINDVVLQRNRHPRMIEYEMTIAGQFVFRVRADGLVLATPAGSTAYALSAGGAIVHPGLDAISVAPVCPHTLSNRPIVVPAGEIIELRLTEVPAPAALNLDGQMCQDLREHDRIRVMRGPGVTFACLPDRDYYAVLRGKLHWTGREDDTGGC